MSGSLAPAADDADALRARSRRLDDVAAAAERAAGHFAARALVGARDPGAEPIATTLADIATAHRAAAAALSRYATALDDAHQRRAALDELLATARAAPTSDEHVLARVRELRDELVARLDDEVARARTSCARELYAITPTRLTARTHARALGMALDHARTRLLGLAGPEPTADPSDRLAS